MNKRPPKGILRNTETKERRSIGVWSRGIAAYSNDDVRAHPDRTKSDVIDGSLQEAGKVGMPVNAKSVENVGNEDAGPGA